MSRCFPYPPPGYTLSRSKDEALIESIKLQKEREKAQKKKEKKREKRGKRKEKKEEKRKENKETEQLERSSVSEEHGQPVYLHAPSSSSGSTEYSNKRKILSSPIHSSHGHGNIIKIRLTSKKQNEPDPLANENRGCSTTGRTDFPPQNNDNTGLRDRRDDIHCTNICQHFAPEADGQQICSTSKPFGATALCKTGIPSVPNAVTSKMQKEELWIKNLVENLVPLQSLNECFQRDEDWLFQDRSAEKRQRCGNDVMSSSTCSGLWPRAQYLNEANVYALPFTVPF
ncbi:hypothetical protein ACJIZ3_024790 [Penstemon smallii]|uniref:Uncharacterized protein n=1 Tax=Penstemon smallii TaxID=265156 RepID=A0ABD3TSX6_9LAMI